MRKIQWNDAFWWLLLLLFLFLLVFFTSCAPFGTTIAVDTNLPWRTSGLTVINTTPYTFSILIDGVENAKVGPYGKFAAGLWNGSYYGFEVAVSVVGVEQVFAHTEKVWVWPSSYSRYSSVLTIRQDEDGQIWVERR